MSGLLCVVGSQMPTPWELMFSDLAFLGVGDRGEWHDPASTVSLGRHQFYNTPEARKETPVVEAEGCVLIWDGRLDARESLLADRFEVTDARLIIESYRRWGINCLKHLLGEYVFILWDKAEKLLFVGCDVTGGRTINYYWDGKTLLLASRAVTLLHHPQVSPKLNDLYVAHTLNISKGHPPGITIFQEIQRLLPGQAMVLRRGNLKQFSVARLKQPSLSTFSSPEACYEQFWHTCNLAVKDRLRTDRPVATYLTGGLDSTTVTLAILERSLEVDAFTNTTTIFPEFDEREPIQAFLKRYPQVRWHGINGDRSWALQEPWDELPLPDDPLIACTIPMHLQLMQEMKRLGCQTVFEGDWGDEVFNVGLRDLAGTRLASAVVKGLKYCSNNSQRKSFLYQYFLLPNLPQFLSKYLVKGVSIVPWLQPDYIESPIFQRSLQQKFYSRLPKSAIQTIANYASQTASVGYRQTFRLLAKFYGLQITAPFQDRRIIEFSLAVQPDLKLSNEHYKIFLRHVNREKLPEEILWRPKENYFNPLTYAGLAKGEKPLELLDYLHSSTALQAYFDKDKLAHTLHWYRQEFAHEYRPNTRYKPQQTAQLFASFTFINWYKKLDREVLQSR